jgi:hypothetical protein
MRRNTSVLALLPTTGLAATCGTAYPANEVDGTLVASIVLAMGTDAATMTDTQYDQYFSQGNATTGVAAVIAAGNFYLNLWALPATEEAFTANSTQCLETGYLVNHVAWLSYDSTTASWTGGYEGETAAASYAAAALAVAEGIVAGLEVRFWDTDGDGLTDLIDADFLEGVTVDTITQNANGTVSVYRGDIDTAAKTTSEGTVFDGSLFQGAGPAIPTANFDTAIAAGDVALFWYGPNGWAMKRAQEVNGIFIDGADHSYYDIDGVQYADAMRFSRDNIFISNRPGEFTDAQKAFGFTNNTAAGLNVSLWVVPVTNTANTGAPISLTAGSNSKTFLGEAAASAQATLDGVVVSADGLDVPSSEEWVTQAAYTQLEDAIARANSTLSSTTASNFLADYQTYLLYLVLDGSANDIGAVYAGFSYTGFNATAGLA